MEHTPLPWANNGGQIEGPGGFPNVVARVGEVNNQTVQDTANARLIVAAVNAHEELLTLATEMLEYEDKRTENTSILDVLEAWGTFVDQAQAAIAKAKGTRS